MIRTVSFFVIGYSLFLAPASAGAEIVVFKNGRTMSAKSYQIVGDMATLKLRDGGQVTFPASIIERIDQDEPVARVDRNGTDLFLPVVVPGGPAAEAGRELLHLRRRRAPAERARRARTAP